MAVVHIGIPKVTTALANSQGAHSSRGCQGKVSLVPKIGRNFVSFSIPGPEPGTEFRFELSASFGVGRSKLGVLGHIIILGH